MQKGVHDTTLKTLKVGKTRLATY